MLKKLRLRTVLLVLLILAGCGGNSTVDTGTAYNIYYLNKDETKISSVEYYTQETETEGLVQELLETLKTNPDDMKNRAPISGMINLVSYGIEEDQLILKFDERYKELSPTTEILVRAAIVRTMTQIKDINYVTMQIRDENLTDALGNPVGVMTPEMFIDNAGDEINAYEKVKLRLYFANEDGTRLVEVLRPFVIRSNISLEKLVVEELIKGPNNDEIYPTINPETKVNSVTVKDGICYVNLNETFLTQVYNVNADVTLYSITNSLVELPNVNKVQISINGETEVMYRETIKLTTVLERNLELVGKEQG